MKRRTLLSAAGATVTLGLTGCLDEGATPPTPTPGQPDVDFVVVSNSCGTGADRATIAFEPAAVSVTGTAVGRDACETARLAAARVDQGTLRIAIETVRAAPPDVVCAQCLTDIEYQLTATFAESFPAEVVVSHDGETITRRAPQR